MKEWEPGSGACWFGSLRTVVLISLNYTRGWKWNEKSKEGGGLGQLFCASNWCKEGPDFSRTFPRMLDCAQGQRGKSDLEWNSVLGIFFGVPNLVGGVFL